MAYTYIFDPIAADEYEEAFKWYERSSPTAADNLIVVVHEAILEICGDPFRFRKTHKELRELTLKKYPFNLIYFIDDKKKRVTITSLFHHRRNPKKKYKKSKRK
jgi:plasmid stabilization system protein ParE